MASYFGKGVLNVGLGGGGGLGRGGSAGAAAGGGDAGLHDWGDV